MAMRCGCCGGEHESLALVRACCAGQPPGPAPGRLAIPYPEPPRRRPPRHRAARPHPAGRGLGRPALSWRGDCCWPPARCPRHHGTAPPCSSSTSRPSPTRHHWWSRSAGTGSTTQRVVVRARVALPESGEREHRPPQELGARFEPALDALAHLLRWSFVDGRDPQRARFAPAELAVAAGARPVAVPIRTPDTSSLLPDVLLPDGRGGWCDSELLRHVTGLAHPVLPRVLLEAGRVQPLGPNRTAAALAPDQLAAVTHPGGGARIIAPAGSGKTRVLTERARHLVQRVAPARLRAVPGGVQPAGRSRRWRPALADVPGLQVRTLNALALEVLQGRRPFAPSPSGCAPSTSPRSGAILASLVKCPVGPTPTRRPALARRPSACGSACVDPAEVERRYGGDVAPASPTSCGATGPAGAPTGWSTSTSRSSGRGGPAGDPDARTAARRACRVLLVDEFQDLTPAHLLLVRLLAGPDLCVFGVGDDDQTIYGYNGADARLAHRLPHPLPGRRRPPPRGQLPLPAPVVAAATTWSRHNRRRVPKVIRSAEPPVIGGWSAVEHPDTVTATVSAVAEALAAGRTPPSAPFSRGSTISSCRWRSPCGPKGSRRGPMPPPPGSSAAPPSGPAWPGSGWRPSPSTSTRRRRRGGPPAVARPLGAAARLDVGAA
jgi:hypothetical protein